MEKSQTDDELKRLEKNEYKIRQSVLDDQKVATIEGQNLPTEPSRTSPNEPCNPKTCHLEATSSPGTIDHCLESISRDVPRFSADQKQMSIIKITTINSKDHPVVICCLAAKDKPSTTSTLKNCTSGDNTSESDGTTPYELTQGTGRNVMYHSPKCQRVDTAPIAGSQVSAVTKSGSEPCDNLSKPSTIRATVSHQCEISQRDQQSLQFQMKRDTIKQSAFKSVSRIGTTENCNLDLETDSTTMKNRFGNGQTSSPFTCTKLPFQDQSCAKPILKQSPVKSYAGSWDPLCHHMCDHEKNMTLPRDLRCLKETELLPMAPGDFTKCLEEDLCCSPAEMMTLADDDSVVPSSPLLPGDVARCSVRSDASSTDGSPEYSWEGFSAHDENILYKLPSLSYDYPQYGTLNWGLTPTIIYKTPDPKNVLNDVGDDYMKCSISEGNVELLTPPPPNYKKLLRRSRRRMERRNVKRRRIYFGNDEDYQGLQEVPVNESQKDSETSLDTDFVPDDPMWFEDEDVNILSDSEDKPFSINEQDIVDCCEYLGNVSPNCEDTVSTYQILTEALENIKNLEGTLDGLSRPFANNGSSGRSPDLNPSREENAEVLEKESDTRNELNSQMKEIQDSLHQTEGVSLNGCEKASLPDLSVDEEKRNKRKKKYQKSSNKKRKTPRKHKKSDGSSKRQRSDCDTIPLSEDNVRSSSSSRCNSQGSRCVTPILPKPPPGVLISPSLAGFIPLQAIGKPLILPKPPHQEGYFSPSTSPLLSPLASPQLVPNMTQTLPTWLGSGELVKMPAKKCHRKAKRREKPIEEKGKGRQKGLQKKTIPSGCKLYCKEKRNCSSKANTDLKSKPEDVTKRLSKTWKQLSEEEQRPYM